MKGKLFVCGLALWAVACAGPANDVQGPRSLLGKSAPKLTVQSWHNTKPLTLEKLRGKVVVLDFWAFW